MSQEGYIERFRLPGLQAAKIVMKKGDVIPLHDHPCSSVCMLVIEGKVKMKVFKRLSQEGDVATLQLEKEHLLGPTDVAMLEKGDSNFHSVECLEDCYIFDAFSCDDPEQCVSVFYAPENNDTISGPFKAREILTEEAAIPSYFFS